MDKSLIQEFKKLLEEEHDKLVAELRSIAVPDGGVKGNWIAKFPKFEREESGSHANMDEEADEVEEYEARLEAEHSLESRLLEVTKALERIQNNRYGRCGKCNRPINTERLRANPAAEFDIEHSK